ncbi:general stress protein 26 [Devosia sp. UYZn731]|uniref:pyridoxamine 5'-phosphate oxidase family protein n=1 Tax=Devosia sp. UYZn731 TaxID=3156345 RepID=UPI0033991058
MASTAATTETKSTTPAPRTPPAKQAKPKAAATKAAPARKPVAKSSSTTKAAKPAITAKPKPKANGTAHHAHGEHVDRIWELAKRIGVCMFVTWDGERQRSRPLQANVDRDEHAIYFLTDVDGHKDDQVENFPIVTLAFADIPHSKYVSITGKGTVLNDRAKIKELWSPFAQAWWDNADDPAIRVIKVAPQDAELWDSPGRVVTAISMLAAAVTRRSPKIGENAKVKL